jgi:hypothetical protein
MKELASIVPKYSFEQINAFDTAFKFMEAYVELLKDSVELMHLCLYNRYFDLSGEPKVITRDEAIIGGNMVRMCKLNTSFIQNICERKLEICFIINRCIAETGVNIKYMLIEGEPRVRKNYIKHSLRTEKELSQIILDNIRKRGENVLPIEARMQESIRRSFEKSDFEFDEVSNSSKWKSIKSRSEVVAGPEFYSVLYGIASHSVHGNWQDILYNHLHTVDGGFKLDTEWQQPRPQLLDATIQINLDINYLFVEKEFSDAKLIENIRDKIEQYFGYWEHLKLCHEKWLNKINGG